MGLDARLCIPTCRVRITFGQVKDGGGIHVEYEPKKTEIKTSSEPRLGEVMSRVYVPESPPINSDSLAILEGRATSLEPYVFFTMFSWMQFRRLGCGTGAG